MSELRFDGKVAVVTGGGRGLGRDYALLLAARGAKVVVNDNGSAILGEGEDVGPAQSVVDEITALGGEAVANVDSVATEEGGAGIIQSALDTFGRIDIVIHNAGNVRYGALDEISFEDFKAVTDVHLMGAFHVVRASFPHMKAQNYGRFVMTGSIGGYYGNQRCVNYAVSKSAMIGLSNVISLEGQEHNVKSNVILPGAVTRMADGLDTSLYPPMGPELVAPVVAYLCHESCEMAGQSLMSMAGRVCNIHMEETVGVYRPAWSIEDVAANLDGINDRTDAKVFGLSGYLDHLGFSFQMARDGGA